MDISSGIPGVVRNRPRSSEINGKKCDKLLHDRAGNGGILIQIPAH
jgi:hypothetical protein